ncbi:8-amino-7-oxononanoate synthase [Blastomonas sp.]|uniref:8-amino-7-oxononanoate synthase n=1 Tax=Blastomonas sp. TaxID=1909299 RepID=UPI002605E1CB|nr:8-amino-7-oxononanoate synthase [Blastomonas sp.]MDM7956463.1 8-amino-7-oxononanoate synthase [Blastomonas sp.]
MATPPFETHAAQLGSLKRDSRLRALASRTGKDFASNDYLGLAGSTLLHDALREGMALGLPAGSGGSRLLRGNHAAHEALEADAAAHFGSEAALFFAAGFAANAALFATLPQRGDLVVHDALIHASAHDGMRLGRAETCAAAHNDAQGFDDAIIAWRAQGGTGRAWIAVESLYSMDGDCAPLAELAQVAARHDAVLVIDEAHATGVHGPRGAGLAHNLAGMPNVITLHTCGKALGCEGALICGPRVAIDFLINRARPFVFSTAPSPLIAHMVRRAIALVAGHDDWRDELFARIAEARRALAPRLGVDSGTTQILPVIIGDDARTMRIAASLQRQGFDIRGIRPPTVPQGTARLRISITRNVSMGDIGALTESLDRIMIPA